MKAKLQLTKGEICNYVVIRNGSFYPRDFHQQGTVNYLFPRRWSHSINDVSVGDEKFEKHPTISRCFARGDLFSKSKYFKINATCLVDCLIVKNITQARRLSVCPYAVGPQARSSLNSSHHVSVGASSSNMNSYFNFQTASSPKVVSNNTSEELAIYPKVWYCLAIGFRSSYPWLMRKMEESDYIKILSNLLNDDIDDLNGKLMEVFDFKSCKVIPRFKSKLLDSDDIISSSSEVSLRCPLSMCRIKVPGKFVSCPHYQCF